MDRDHSEALLAAALVCIDERNALDPNELSHAGAGHPRELLLGTRATHWLLILDPDADAAQQIAARAHHLERWLLPREAHPPGRAGYLRWRREQQQRHALAIGTLLEEVGIGDDVVLEVQALIRKVGRGRRAQTHEDALCLAFLEVQLGDVAERLGPEKAREVLRKTARKMSPRARVCAAEAVGEGAAADLAREVLAET